MGEDGTWVVEAGRPAVMSATRSRAIHFAFPPFPLLRMYSKLFGSWCPLTKGDKVGLASLGEAGRPTLWPIFFNAAIFDAKQKFKFWFKILNMPWFEKKD